MFHSIEYHLFSAAVQGRQRAGAKTEGELLGDIRGGGQLKARGESRLSNRLKNFDRDAAVSQIADISADTKGSERGRISGDFEPTVNFGDASWFAHEAYGQISVIEVFASAWARGKARPGVSCPGACGARSRSSLASGGASVGKTATGSSAAAGATR